MIGSFVDSLRFSWKSTPEFGEGFSYMETDFGKIRFFDTKGFLPVIINVPDGPNVIEHHQTLIKALSKNFRVICFEYPGLGFSFPNRKFDYSFRSGSKLLLQLMDILKIDRASLLFSCSNGYYAVQAGSDNPDRFQHIFLSQTPSTGGLLEWTKSAIPAVLKTPVIGQLANSVYSKKLARLWYKYSLPKNHPATDDYYQIAINSMNHGGCFCLSSLVQGLKKDRDTTLELVGVPTTLVWGSMDFTHRRTDKDLIRTHIKDCEIIEFKDCGHFPELEKTTHYITLIKERAGY